MPYSYHISFLTIPPHLQINLFHNTITTPKCTLRSVLLCLCFCVFYVFVSPRRYADWHMPERNRWFNFFFKRSHVIERPCS